MRCKRCNKKTQVNKPFVVVFKRIGNKVVQDHYLCNKCSKELIKE